MKKITSKILLVMAVTLPIGAFASSAVSGNLAMNTQAWLQTISHQISQANDTRSQAWKQYFNQDKLKQKPANNLAFLSKTSGYQNIANHFVFAPGSISASDQSLPVQIYCRFDSDRQFCQAAQAGDSGSAYSRFNSSQIMDYNFAGSPNFTTNSDYVGSVLSSALSLSSQVNTQSSLAGSSAIYNALTQIKNSYSKPPITRVKGKDGKMHTISLPSEMKAIKTAVNAPFKQAYFNDLSVSTVPQSNRLIAELLAENNLMKYKIIRQNQTRTILESNLLSQQIKSNRIAKENLMATRTLIAMMKKNQGD